MDITKIKKVLDAHKERLAKKYYVSKMGIFGSYAKNQQTKKSDIDILVDFFSPISLFEFIDLEEDLSSLLKVKVDLVSRKALKPYIGKRILNEVQMV